MNQSRALVDMELRETGIDVGFFWNTTRAVDRIILLRMRCCSVNAVMTIAGILECERDQYLPASMNTITLPARLPSNGIE